MKLKNIKLKFERLYSLNNYTGIKDISKIIINHIFSYFIAIGYIYKGQLSDIKYIPKNQDFEFRIMNKFDLDIMQINYQKEFNEKRYLDILSKLNTINVDGFIVKNKEDIFGYFFLEYGKSESELERKYLNFKKNGYIFGDYIFERYRGKKIQQYSIYKRLMILKDKKYETATCLIERNNIPSIKSYEKFGFQRYLIKYFFRFGNLIRSKDHYKNI